MRHRTALAIGYAVAVFVGVLLVILSTDLHVVKQGLPIALLAAAAAGLAGWRFSNNHG